MTSPLEDSRPNEKIQEGITGGTVSDSCLVSISKEVFPKIIGHFVKKYHMISSQSRNNFRLFLHILLLNLFIKSHERT